MERYVSATEKAQVQTMKVARTLGAALLAAATVGSCSTGEEEPAPVDAPAGFEEVSAPGASVAFAAPQGWVDVAPDQLGGAATEVLEQVAGETGQSVQELHENAQEADTFLIDPDSADFADPDNLLVGHQVAEAPQELPTEQEVQAVFESYGREITQTVAGTLTVR